MRSTLSGGVFPNCKVAFAFVFCRNLGETKDLVHQNATEESERGREWKNEGERSRAERHWIAKITAEEVAILRCFANWPRRNGMKSAGDDEPYHRTTAAGKEEEEAMANE